MSGRNRTESVSKTTSGMTEIARLAVAGSYRLESDGIPAQLDRLARLAATSCKAPVGLVSLVEADRQRFIGRSGTDLTETPRADSFCAHAMLEADCMVIPNAARDPRFSDNPLVTGPPFIRFYAGQPLVSREGAPLGSLCIIDTAPREGLDDEQRLALETIAEAVMALLERWRLEDSSGRERARTASEIAHLEQRFQVLADAMPQLVWSTTPEGLTDYFSGGWCAFTGQPAEASYGRDWMQFLHEEDKVPAAIRWREAVESGDSYEIEYRLRRYDGEYRWVLARGLPVRAEDGAIIRWIGTCTDIHEQKADAERLDVLSRELNHRIKNIFAVIGGLIAMTIRSKPEFKATAIELRDRVLALGRAHDFVRSRGGNPVLHPHARLMGLFRTLLAPYQDAEEQRIVLRGDDVAIDDRSATPLALFVHELATNAVKYGALSEGGGRIEIVVTQGDQVEIAWSESGGPIIAEPSEFGFGSSLIDMSIIRQLGGKLDYAWNPEGLRVTARIAALALAR